MAATRNSRKNQILPPDHRVRVAQRPGPVTQAALDAADAAIILCPADQLTAAITDLPYADLWQDLHRVARKRGPVTQLSGRLPNRLRTTVIVATVKDNATPFALLSMGARLWKELGVTGRELLIATARTKRQQVAAILEPVVAAVLAGSAPLPSFKSKPDPASPLRSVTLLHGGSAIDLAMTQAGHAGNHLARWLTTLPPDRLNTSNYRRALEELARREGWRYKFLGEADLKRLGAGAFLAVARANPHRDAGIVRLTYRPNRTAKGRYALVGKGICFDTGGINLKPHKSMYTMHEDMQGSAVAVGTLLALAQLRVPYEVDCWLAVTENHIGPNAYLPQEIVTAVNGTTIQVVHSDAEGRMALADTLALAAREKPQLIIDFATLTGACVMALTERYSGVFTNRAAWRSLLEATGRDSGERVWNFPMDDDFDSDLETPVADVLQCSMEGKGDHILAARFLSRFVPADIPWVHVDLSSSSHRSGLAHVPAGFTGFGVRFATHLLLKQSLLKS